jgi:hypothetical protein
MYDNICVLQRKILCNAGPIRVSFSTSYKRVVFGIDVQYLGINTGFWIIRAI